MTKEQQSKDFTVINSVVKVQYSQTLGLLFLLKGSSQKKYVHLLHSEIVW